LGPDDAAGGSPTPSEKLLILVEGQNPILADKLRFFATKPFREIEAFARSHVPSVPASEFLPPQPVPATTQAYANAGEAGEVFIPPTTIGLACWLINRKRQL